MSAGLILALPCALIGAAVGSWLGAALVRGRRGESAFSGRSRCDHCSIPLNYAETLPLVSFITMRGRCRHCGGAISRLHPLSELMGALAGTALALGIAHV